MPKYILIEHGFDRIKLWLDHSEYPGDLDEVRMHCGDVVHTVGQMPYGAVWKSSLELYQPTCECLRLVRTALGSEVRIQPDYVEIAIDLIPTPARPHLAKSLERAFLASAVPKYHRREAVCVEGTWYFERRTEQGVDRRPNVLTCYADRPSKINNKTPAADAVPCLHIEWRISGIQALRRHGLRNLDDLLALKHSQFWPRHIELFTLPGSTQLGRLLGNADGSADDASGQAYRQRAARWIRRHSISTVHGESVFVLYNALRGRNRSRRIFQWQRSTFKRWLRTALKDAHGPAMSRSSRA